MSEVPVRISTALAALHPDLKVGAWVAEATGLATDVPPLPTLGDVAAANPEATTVARRMSAFFRDAGARGRSPVEFQIQKAREGELGYSGRSPLVDFLLYAEVRTGLIVGMHDLDRMELPIVFGTGEEGLQPGFDHISGRRCPVRAEEPVLMSGGEIIASLIKGPDARTKLRGSTRALWGVVFGAPEDSDSELAAALELVCSEGERRGLWVAANRGLASRAVAL